MWKTIRIGLLLIVLAAVALHAWLDRVGTHSWREPLWVGIFPLNGDGTAQAADYVSALRVESFRDIEEFCAREAHRYGLRMDEPVHVELYPAGSTLPPQLPADAGFLGRAWWSLRLRLFAAGRLKPPWLETR